MLLNLISIVVTAVLSHALLDALLAQDLVLSFVETSVLITVTVVVLLHAREIVSSVAETNVLIIVLVLAHLHAKVIVSLVVEINVLKTVLENAVRYAVEIVLILAGINVLSLVQLLVMEALLAEAEMDPQVAITDVTVIVPANVQLHVLTLVHHGAQADVQEIALVAA